MKTLKLLVIALVVVIWFLLIDLAFFLMNLQSTLSFIIGILLLLGTIGLPIEHVYLTAKNKKK